MHIHSLKSHSKCKVAEGGEAANNKCHVKRNEIWLKTGPFDLGMINAT